MEENEKKEEKNYTKSIITGGLIFIGAIIFYRIGAKRGYKKAMSEVEEAIELVLSAYPSV